MFCGSKKSLASGVPMAIVLLPAAPLSLTVLPLMLFHQIQLMVCAWLARRFAARPAVSQPAEELLAGFGTDAGRAAGPAAQDMGV